MGRQVRPVAIIADDEETGRMLLTESVEQVGLAPLAYDNGKDALEAALSVRRRHRPSGRGNAGLGRLCGMPAVARRSALHHDPHRHGDRPRGSDGDRPCFRCGRHRLHGEAGQLGAAAATPGVHPAQCGHGRAHREARLLRSPHRAAEPATLPRDGGAAICPGCAIGRGGRGHLSGSQQLQADQRYLRPLRGRCGVVHGRR